MLLTQIQRLLLLKMIIKRFLSLESQLVVGTYRLHWLNGFAISLNMNTPTIIIVHQDVPGMIAHGTEALFAMILTLHK